MCNGFHWGCTFIKMKEFLSDEQIDEIEQFGIEYPSQVTAYDKTGEKVEYDFRLFSIPDLIDLLPEEVNGGRLVIYRLKDGKWGAYFDNSDSEVFKADELIDALFELVRECVKKNEIHANEHGC